MKPLKPPLSYHDQVERLKTQHALIIDDEQSAQDILSHVNYYRLSAYGIGLKRKENLEHYLPGVSLDYLYRLYRFDSHLRNILIPIIEYLEIELRTKIAYHLAMTYGAEGFLESANFTNKTNGKGEKIYDNTIKKWKFEIEKHSKTPCVAHHKKMYGGHFPVWVAIEFFSFGMLSSLFSVMEKQDQESVAAQYHTDACHLKSWILSLREIRNHCAHYSRIYNMPLQYTPKLYKEHKKYHKERLFSVLLVIHRMTYGTNEWNNFHVSLLALLEQYPEANHGFMGFPSEWQQVLDTSPRLF